MDAPVSRKTPPETTAVLRLVLIFCVVVCRTAEALSKANKIIPNSKNHLYLAKTRETFKFADLQYLQAKLDADTSTREGAYQCRRLVLDSATGSTLFRIIADEQIDLENLPPSFARCEWLAEVLSIGDSASDLVHSLINDGGIEIQGCTGWTMDYIRMNPVQKQGQQPSLNYNLKTLLCSVSPFIRAPPVLDAKDASDNLIVVETTSQGIYLARFVQNSSRITWEPPASWPKRPFQYSSAIHPTVAEILVELVFILTNKKENIRFWDPTCGSGTFLAFALAFNGATSVEGWDVNPQCVEGTRANLEHAFGPEILASSCQVVVKDSSMAVQDAEKNQVDCAIANLPWGQNTIDYANQNPKILKSVRTRLNVGAPCLFIHKDGTLSNPKTLRLLGYDLLGEAFIPPLDFALPKSRKKSKANHNDNDIDGSDGQFEIAANKCQRITVTRAI